MGSSQVPSTLAASDKHVIFDDLDRTLFDAYGCLEDTGTSNAEYLETHYKRYRTTLSFIGLSGPLKILELGAAPPFAFTAMLAHCLPESEIVLAYNKDGVSVRFFDSFLENGRLELSSKDPRAFRNLSLETQCFNAERDVWPLDSGSFDLVLSMEILEHLLWDPCFMFRECHRVLKPDGRFIVTTPNVARLEGVLFALLNRSPYSFGPYSPYGPYGRHNREYAPHELRLVGESSGFATEELTTYDVYPTHSDLTIARRALAELNDDPALRHQNIFYKGRKSEAAFRSYPEALYEYDVPEHNAIIRVLRYDSHMRKGGMIRIAAEVVNTGRYEWSNTGADATNLGIQLLDTAHRVLKLDFIRASLPHRLQPGGSAVLEFTAPDPGLGGAFCLKLDMVHEGVCWFSTTPRGGKWFADAPGVIARPVILTIQVDGKID